VRMTLRSRTVLITGAARGIGAELARQAAAKGARVAAVGLEPALLTTVTAGLEGDGHTWHEADVTDQGAVAAAVDAVARAHGGIDVVVANAGVANLGTVAVSEVEALVRTIEVNLIGVVRTASATLPHLRTAGGYLLLMSSAAAFTALPGMAAYCASKAGVEQFGTVLRLENARTGLGVGTAHPIWIDTDLVRDLRQDLPTFQAGLSRLPWPLSTVVSVRRCAETLIRGIERRRRRVYVPRTIGGVQLARTLFTGPVAEAVLNRTAGEQVATMEAEVRALGRSFGEHSVGGGER